MDDHRQKRERDPIYACMDKIPQGCEHLANGIPFTRNLRCIDKGLLCFDCTEDRADRIVAEEARNE